MKQKSHFLFFSVKRHLLPILFCLFTICLVIFSRQNLQATKNGLLLWANAVVPSLLPFFIATELLGHTQVVSYMGKLFHRIMRPIFNVPGEGGYAFIMGIISGYPIGAKIVTQFRNQGICTKAEGERLLAFTNNSGPLFIIGTVGISLFYDVRTGLLLFATHLIACICVGIIFRFWKFHDTEPLSQKSITSKEKPLLVTFSNLGEVLSSSITNAISTVVMIGGFVILFSVILSILENTGILAFLGNSITPLFSALHLDPNFATPLISGMLELTNGVKQLATITTKALSTNIVFASFLLGFGGISVLLQVLSITSKSDISIKPYFLGKLLQGCIAAILTYLVLSYLPFFNLDLVPVFSATTSKHLATLDAYYNFCSIFILCLVVLFTSYLIWKKRKSTKVY